MKKFFTTILVALMMALMGVGAVGAQTGSTSSGGGKILPDSNDEFKVSEILVLPGQQKAKFLEDVDNAKAEAPVVKAIKRFIDIAVLIIGSFAFLMMVVAGLMMMFSGAGTNQDQAKNMFVYSLVGVAVAMSAYIIATFVQALVTGA